MLRGILVSLAVPLVALAVAPSASAGTAEFENEINSQNVDIGMVTFQRQNLQKMGQGICDKFRLGHSYDDVVAGYPPLFGDGPRVVRIAQQTICPETIK